MARTSSSTKSEKPRSPRVSKSDVKKTATSVKTAKKAVEKTNPRIAATKTVKKEVAAKRKVAGKKVAGKKKVAARKTTTARSTAAATDRRAKPRNLAGATGEVLKLDEVAADPAADRMRREQRNEKVKELIKLAETQGYLTFEDINETIPESVVSAEELESYLMLLRGMDIEIIESADVDKYEKAVAKASKTARSSKLDVFDDPIRMYLHQMGQVPLLTREQEVEICKRIENAEIEIRRLYNLFGFSPGMYLELIDRLESGQERFDRIIADKLADSREDYF